MHLGVAMQRVMIIGQPGSGKSWLAREMGRRSGLPVFHMDHIHWQSGWIERDRAEKDRLCQAVEAGEAWIFEGGHSATYASRAARCDLLIWLDVPVSLRLWRVTWRSVTGLVLNRPDLPEGCPERPANLPEFWRFIWRTRTTARARMELLVAGARPGLRVVHLCSRADMAQFLDSQ